MKLASVVVPAVLLLGACASSRSAGSGSAPPQRPARAADAPAANAPAARPEGLVKCERDLDCDGGRICFDGFCRK